MDIKGYDIKDSTKCKCGHEFDIHEINGLHNIDNHGFFSNVVRTCSKIHCPKCGRETILLLKQKGQTWEILGLGVKDTENTAKPDKIETKVTKEVTKETTINNTEEKTKSNELICPVCKKVCKSKIGLNAHMKTHSK